MGADQQAEVVVAVETLKEIVGTEIVAIDEHRIVALPCINSCVDRCCGVNDPKIVDSPGCAHFENFKAITGIAK